MESPSSAIRAAKPNPKSPSPAATTTSNHLVPVVGSTATLQRRPSSAKERDESERNREEPAGLVSPSIGHGCRGLKHFVAGHGEVKPMLVASSE